MSRSSVLAQPEGLVLTEPPAGPCDRFDDIYTAVYAILDDAKAMTQVVKLYKGSHLSPNPHESVLRFGEFFAKSRRGLFGYACSQVDQSGRPTVDDLDLFDRLHRPRLPTRHILDAVAGAAHQRAGSLDSLLGHLATRRHHLAAYRGSSTGFDEESRAVASVHFRQLGIPSTPDEVVVSCGGIKGIVLAVCAALMCRRQFDELHHEAGIVLAPEGFYQSLRLIPAVFGGVINTVPQLSGSAVRRWLARTAEHRNRIVYAPLVNNATGEVLTTERAREIGTELLAHNAQHQSNPVWVIGDDVYVGTYLDPQLDPMPIGAVPGLSDWTVSVVSPSKTFALATSRVAFATTTNPQLAAALRHYRTVFAHGRVPQTTELLAAAALALTPTEWIAGWNRKYRRRLNDLEAAVHHVNRQLGSDLIHLGTPAGGWYVPLAITRSAFPIPINTSIDAMAVLLHYGGDRFDTGVAMLPGELFGQRIGSTDTEFLFRATLAAPEHELSEFTRRLHDALLVLRGPSGSTICRQALQRVRRVADIDTIVLHTPY